VSPPSGDAPGTPGDAPGEPPEDAPAGTPAGVTDGQETPSDVRLPGQQPPAGEPAGEPPAEDQLSLPARLGEERIDAPVLRTGMFGVQGTGDTSGYGRLQVHKPLLPSAEPPYGGYFDTIAQGLGSALEASGSGFAAAIERVVTEYGELTFYVRREHLVAVMDRLLHDPALRFEIFSGVSGVHYPAEPGRELHAVYHLLSITHNRRLRLEVAAPDADPHIPSVTGVYPAANWHERETWDFFGIIFDGHPALTRIEMPDDWPGHPQRKDYPLGGIPVEYRGTKVPAPDERRSYS
jgi:NADH-quinone oxidoreductase subunit C